MNISLRCIPVILLTVFLALCAGAAAAPQRLQSIRADFVQEKHMKILAQPLVSEGKFIFQSPRSLRWEYRSPISSLLLMHAGNIRKFIEKNGKLVEDKSISQASMETVLTGIGGWLEGRIEDTDVFSVSFADEKSIVLKPKKAAMAQFINRIELTLSGEEGLLDQISIVEGPDTFTTITFSNRILNRSYPASVFTSK